MSNEKNYDPGESIKRITEMWEKGLNDLLMKSLDRSDLVRMTKVGVESHSKYVEILRRNQELLAFYMNLPTKNDVANVAKLTVQAEEKMDLLEEQMWNLQDSFTSANNEHVKLFTELLEFTKQLKDEWLKTSQELADTKKIAKDLIKLKKELVETQSIKKDLLELKQDLAQLNDLKKELSDIQVLLKKDEPELAITQSR
jgi:hypothetical protein